MPGRSLVTFTRFRRLTEGTRLTKRLKASERKAAILAVAKVLFSDKGYHGVSVDEIARRGGAEPDCL